MTWWLAGWTGLNHISSKKFAVDKNSDSVTVEFDLKVEGSGFIWDVRLGTTESGNEKFYAYRGALGVGEYHFKYKLMVSVELYEVLWLGFGVDDSSESKQTLIRNVSINTSGEGDIVNHG
jgi:hypothetical protein